MKNWKLIPILLLSLSLIVSCSNDEDLQEDDLADGFESTIDSIVDGMADINNSEGGDISYLQVPDVWKKDTAAESVYDSIRAFFLPQSLQAATQSRNCLGAGYFEVAGHDWGTTEFQIERTFNGCSGFFGRFETNGSTYMKWSGLSDTFPYVQAGSQLERAPELSVTRIRSQHRLEIQGNSDETLDTEDGQKRLSHRIRWAEVDNGEQTRTMEMTVNVNRVGKTESDNTFMSHSVSTPDGEPLQIRTRMQERIRTVNGTMQLSLNLAGTTLTSTFEDTEFDMDSCLPQGGLVRVRAGGNASGDATLTFPGEGKVEYSYTNQNGDVSSGSFYLESCAAAQ